jgi:hypothetical protein
VYNQINALKKPHLFSGGQSKIADEKVRAASGFVQMYAEQKRPVTSPHQLSKILNLNVNPKVLRNALV